MHWGILALVVAMVLSVAVAAAAAEPKIVELAGAHVMGGPSPAEQTELI